MKKKLLALTLPVGLLIEFIYLVGKHFLGEFSDVAAYPMMIVSIVLMLIGICYNTYCWRKRKNPYDFQ